MSSDCERLSRLKPAAQVLSRQMNGGAVLVDLDSNRIFELSETGARVWALLSEGLDRAQILERLVAEYDVPRDRAATELNELLSQLAGARLLRDS